MIYVHSSVLNSIRSLLILFNGVLNLGNVTQIAFFISSRK